MSDSTQRKAGAVLSYVVIILNIVIQLVYTPFLVRFLGQGEYGLYSLVANIIGYLAVLDLGFGNAIIVYLSKYRIKKNEKEEKKLYGMFSLIYKIITVVVIILGFILYLNVENFFGKTMTNIELEKAKIMMIILTINLAITFAFNIYSSIISVYEKFIFQKLIAIIGIILKPMIMLPILFMGYKSISMVIVLTFINVITVLSNYFYCKRKLAVKVKYAGFDKKIFKEIFIYSFFIFLGVIVDKINWSVDTVILGAISGTVAVSIYSIASLLNTVFVNLSTAVSGVLLPKISKMIAAKNSKEELTNEFIKVGRIQYIIIFFMASSLVLFGKEFIICWVGSEFETSYYIAIILILPLCVPLIQNLGISILQALNKHKFRSILYAFIAIFNIILSIPLAYKFGGIGCAIGTSISLIIGNIIIINIYYHKVIGLNVIKFWKEIVKMSLYFVLPVVIILIFKNFIKLKGILSIVIYGLIYGICYLITLYKLVFNNYEHEIVKKILYRIKKEHNNG